MIIKIKGKKVIRNFSSLVAKEGEKPERELSSYDWWIYDNIEKVRHGLRRTKNKIIDKDAHIIIPANEEDFNPNMDSSEKQKYDELDYIWIVARNDKNNEFTIATNSTVFLLNDHGQTIERLTV